MIKEDYGLSKILMRPIIYNDLIVTFIELKTLRYDTGWSYGFHKHPWYEFHYISEGAIYTTIENIEFKVEPGYFYIIPPGSLHAHRHFNNMGNIGFCARWLLEKINIPPEIAIYRIADRIIESMPDYNCCCFKYPADKILEKIINVSIEEAESALIHWLMNIYRILNPYIETAHSGDNDKNNIIIKQISLYLEKEYYLDIDVQSLAASFGYSYRHLARMFREATGMSIIEKLNNIRIAKAMELLQNTNLFVKNICDEVGFKNMAYFSTKFSQYTHKSPTQFRGEYRKREE